MKKYLGLDVAHLHKDLGAFIHPEHMKLHLLLQHQAMEEIEKRLDVLPFFHDFLGRKTRTCRMRT